MSRWRFVPLLIVGAAIALVPVAAFTESGVETDVKDALGLIERCVPDTVASAGWREEPLLPERRDEPRATVAAGQVYIAGGQSELVRYGEPSPIRGVNELREVTIIDSLTRFDPESGSYTELEPMPVPVNHQAMAAYRGRVYAVGGHGRFLEGASPKANFQRYDPATGEWSSLPAMPTPRGAAAADVIGHRLYVAGGLGSHGRVLRTLEIYDFRTGEWSRGPDMPTAREHTGGAALDGSLYVLGGRTATSDAVDTAERYDAARGRWEELPPMPVATGGLGADSTGDAVLAIGGGNEILETVTPAFQSFDPDTGAWEELPRMNTPRHGHANAVVSDRLYVFGGSPCGGFAASDTVDSYELSPVDDD